jgi:hypothetical protein
MRGLGGLGVSHIFLRRCLDATTLRLDVTAVGHALRGWDVTRHAVRLK